MLIVIPFTIEAEHSEITARAPLLPYSKTRRTASLPFAIFEWNMRYDLMIVTFHGLAFDERPPTWYSAGRRRKTTRLFAFLGAFRTDDLPICAASVLPGLIS